MASVQMPAPASLPAPSAASSCQSPSSAPARDRFLDAIKAVAVLRVLAWHTWGWWPLSWFAAMPTMFCASGVLLTASLARHGYRATLAQRARRLLIPYWAYALVAVGIMVAGGWRPTPRALAGWVVPIVDPTGPVRFAPLWIPLWYLRAYLWILISAPLWRTLSRSRLALVALVALALASNAVPLPMAVRDLVVFGGFVALGMRWASTGYPRPSRAALFALVLGPLAVTVAYSAHLSPTVNASYTLHTLVGAATLAVAFALAPRLRTLTGPAQRAVSIISSRSLSIYLWQGLGLYAAYLAVPDRGSILALAATGAVVAAVTATAVLAFGPLEDLAARRRSAPTPAPASASRLSRRLSRRYRTAIALRLVATALVGALTLVLVLPSSPARPMGTASAPLPPSGQAVVAQGRLTQAALARSAKVPPSLGRALQDPAPTELATALATTTASWTDANRPALDEAGFHWLVGSLIAPDGTAYPLAAGSPPPGQSADTPFSLWSMTKAITGLWLAALVDQGVVHLDDPLARYVPRAPRAERITLGMLARHTAGLPFDPTAEADQPDETASSQLARFAARPFFRAPPGKKLTYSRLGYFYLAWALEKASGVSWSDHVRFLAAAAGVPIAFDDDPPLPGPTAPLDPDYRGRLWASGGIVASPHAAAALFRYALGPGLSPSARALATSFTPDSGAGNGGLGLGPNCGRCARRDGSLIAQRYGNGSYSGMWSYDEASGAVVFLHADEWYAPDASPLTEVYDLADTALDLATGRAPLPPAP